MTMPAVYFSHGQDSGPWGTKIQAMAEAVRDLGCRAESVDYRGISDPGERVARCCATLNMRQVRRAQMILELIELGRGHAMPLRGLAPLA